MRVHFTQKRILIGVSTILFLYIIGILWFSLTEMTDSTYASENFVPKGDISFEIERRIKEHLSERSKEGLECDKYYSEHGPEIAKLAGEPNAKHSVTDTMTRAATLKPECLVSGFSRKQGTLWQKVSPYWNMKSGTCMDNRIEPHLHRPYCGWGEQTDAGAANAFGRAIKEILVAPYPAWGSPRLDNIRDQLLATFHYTYHCKQFFGMDVFVVEGTASERSFSTPDGMIYLSDSLMNQPDSVLAVLISIEMARIYLSMPDIDLMQEIKSHKDAKLIAEYQRGVFGECRGDVNTLRLIDAGLETAMIAGYNPLFGFDYLVANMRDGNLKNGHFPRRDMAWLILRSFRQTLFDIPGVPDTLYSGTARQTDTLFGLVENWTYWPKPPEEESATPDGGA